MLGGDGPINFDAVVRMVVARRLAGTGSGKDGWSRGSRGVVGECGVVVASFYSDGGTSGL